MSDHEIFRESLLKKTISRIILVLRRIKCDYRARDLIHWIGPKVNPELIAKWLPPIFVNIDKGDIQTTLHPVKHQALHGLLDLRSFVLKCGF